MEIAAPILSKEHKDWFSFYLDLILMDNVKARELTSLGTYVKKGKNGRDKIGVQQYYIDHPIQFAKSEIQKNGFLWRLERLFARV